MIVIKRYSLVFIISLIPLLLYLAFSLFTQPTEKIISLTEGDFEHIQFGTRKPNIYQYQEDALVISVDDSASFLMQAFDKVKPVAAVSFEWQSQGQPAIENIEHEKQRSGDDAIFKLGLLIETNEPPTDFFLPSWMRRVNTLLKLPSEEMFFLVAGAKHAAGQTWIGPYNRRITMISMNNAILDQGWNKASYRFSESINVVAIWLMADGDDTHSAFVSRIKNIVIEEVSAEAAQSKVSF